jgi:simple sugar transport system substrate-binding protein
MAVTRRMLGLLLVAMLTLAACTSDGGNGEEAEDGGDAAAGAEQEAGDFTYALVTHASPGDAFWDVVQNGHDQAGADLGVNVTYQGSGDPQEQAQFIDAAVSQEVDGLAVSMANPDALQSSIEAAVEAGIPVITINSGGERSAEFGAITHVGQTESIAGEGAGEQLAEAGATHLVCVIHEAGNIGLEERCGGAADSFGGEVENVQVDINDLAAATSTISALLQSNQSVDAILTLNSSVAGSAISAINEAGRTGEISLATFDVDQSVVDAISAGDMLFAVDQQPYLQGYLPVVMLHLFNTNGNTVGGGQPVLTGPGFITSENVEEVAEFVEGGTR